MTADASHFTFKVMTVNIHKGFTSFNRRFILPELREAVRTVAADVVFLQEVLGTHDAHARKRRRLARRAALRIPGRHASGRSSPTAATRSIRKGHHGNAVLSKFPIVHYQNHDVSIAGPEKRGLLHCVLRRARPARARCMRSACTWACASRTASSSSTCCARWCATRCRPTRR